MTPPSRNALKGDIIKLRTGLAIYQVNASPFWYGRIRDPATGRSVVRSTKTTSRLEAAKVAEELYLDVVRAGGASTVPKNMTFGHFAEQLINNEKLRGERAEIHHKLWANTSFYLNHRVWGANLRFAKTDVRKITTVEYHAYIEWVRAKDGHLKPSTMNHITSAFSKVLKVARDRGAIDFVPALPRVSRKDNPRPFFQFEPLVAKDKDEYQALLKAARRMARDAVRVRESVVTGELEDLIQFVVHTFVRPTETELYALKHRHIAISDEPKALQLTIANGKTGFRVSTSMPYATSIYTRQGQAG